MDDLELLEPGGRIPRRRVVAAARWDSAPIRRAVRKARAEGRLIDLTFGRACHWVYFLDTGHVALGTNGMDDEDSTPFPRLPPNQNQILGKEPQNRRQNE